MIYTIHGELSEDRRLTLSPIATTEGEGVNTLDVDVSPAIVAQTMRVEYEHPTGLARRNRFCSDYVTPAADGHFRTAIPSAVLAHAGKVYVQLTGMSDGKRWRSVFSSDASFIVSPAIAAGEIAVEEEKPLVDRMEARLETLSTEFGAKSAQLVAAFEQRSAELAAAYRATVGDLNAAFETSAASLSQKTDASVADLTARANATLTEVSGKADDALSTLTAQTSASLTDLTNKTDAALVDLTARSDASLEEVKTSYAATFDRLTTDAETALADVVRKQEEAAAALGTQFQNFLNSMDGAPTAGSANPVTSGGVEAAISALDRAKQPVGNYYSDANLPTRATVENGNQFNPFIGTSGGEVWLNHTSGGSKRHATVNVGDGRGGFADLKARLIHAEYMMQDNHQCAEIPLSEECVSRSYPRGTILVALTDSTGTSPGDSVDVIALYSDPNVFSISMDADGDYLSGTWLVTQVLHVAGHHFAIVQRDN